MSAGVLQVVPPSVVTLRRLSLPGPVESSRAHESASKQLSAVATVPRGGPATAVSVESPARYRHKSSPELGDVPPMRHPVRQHAEVKNVSDVAGGVLRTAHVPVARRYCAVMAGPVPAADVPSATQDPDPVHAVIESGTSM